MATQNDQATNFVLEVAELGDKLAARCKKFIVQHESPNHALERIFVTLSITSSVLSELGATIKKHENDFHVEDRIIRPVCKKIMAVYMKLNAMIDDGDAQDIWSHNRKVGDRSFTEELDPSWWLNLGIGRDQENIDFWENWEGIQAKLVEVSTVVNYKILKTLSENNNINTNQVQELEKLKQQLPPLIQKIERAAEIAKLDAIAEASKTAASKVEVENEVVYDIGRRNSIRRRSISCSSSISSVSIRELPPNNEVYEQWMFQWTEPRDQLDRYTSFLGIKIKHYWSQSGFWFANAQQATESEMRKQHLLSQGKSSPIQHKKQMRKDLLALPNEVGKEINIILRDRTLSAARDNNVQFTVVSIQPVDGTPSKQKRLFGKSSQSTDYLVTIQGEILPDNKEKTIQPDRFDDPFAHRGRSRSRSLIPQRITPRRYYTPPPPPPPMRIEPRRRHRAYTRRRSPSPPPRIINPSFIRERVSRREEYRWVPVVVKKAVSVEEAEKKMDEIWENMTSPPVEETMNPFDDKLERQLSNTSTV